MQKAYWRVSALHANVLAMALNTIENNEGNNIIVGTTRNVKFF